MQVAEALGNVGQLGPPASRPQTEPAGPQEEQKERIDLQQRVEKYGSGAHDIYAGMSSSPTEAKTGNLVPGKFWLENVEKWLSV